jgi:parvulin-like peptidyl-prolyl isomerase
MIRRTIARSPLAFSWTASAAILAAAAAISLSAATPVSAATPPAESPDSALAIYDGGAVYPQEFAYAWQGQSADDRKTDDLLAKKRAFVRRVVDRELMLREALKRPFRLTPVESLFYERTKSTYMQNALFRKLAEKEPPVTEEDLALFTRQNREFAVLRFINFKNETSARSWRQRITRGVPMSVLDNAIKKGGPDAPTADELRAVAAELIPDSLARTIWTMRPGELSDVMVQGQEVALIHVQSFIPRTSPVNLRDPKAVAEAYEARIQERVRQKMRLQLHQELAVHYDDAAMDYLLDRFVKTVPPRQTTDANGTPNYRLTMPMPQIAVNDSARILAWTSRGDTLTIGQYLRYWNDQPASTRPEVRQKEILAATADRVLLLGALVQKAYEQGLDRDSVVVAGLERFHEAVAIDHLYLDEVWNKVDMSPKKLEAYFAARPGHYDDPETLKARLILVDTKSLADSLRARLEAGDSFSELATKFSTEGVSAEKGGQLDLIARGSNVRGNVALEDAMFKTSPGQIGGPMAVPEGFVLWTVDAYFPAKKRTLKDPEALNWTKRDYQIEESEKILLALLDDLHAKAHVKYFPQRVTKDLGANPDLAVY